MRKPARKVYYNIWYRLSLGDARGVQKNSKIVMMVLLRYRFFFEKKRILIGPEFLFFPKKMDTIKKVHSIIAVISLALTADLFRFKDEYT